MREYTIHASEFQTPEELHTYLAGEMEFPEYYGGNLDALYDMLTESCEETIVTVDLTGVQNYVMDHYFTRLIHMLEDVEDECEEFKLNIL